MRIITYGVIVAFLHLGCGDHQPPEVSITMPASGAIVCGITTVHISASDNRDVDSVALLIDGDLANGYTTSPFVYSWNTHILSDSSMHTLCALAYDDDANEGYSDTVLVIVYNGSLVFKDDFESYIHGYPPSPIWFEIWPGVTDSAYVSQYVACEGIKSYHSFGYADFVRTDGIDIDLAGASQLTYECSVMIPGESQNGALFGFFVHITPGIGEIYNGVMFNPEDQLIHVRGVLPDTTDFSWAPGDWYHVRAVLDIAQAFMDVWVDDQLIADDIHLADTAWIDTFAVSTMYEYDGGVYYDNVKISRE